MDSLAVDIVKYLARTANDAVHTRGTSLTSSFNENSGKEFVVAIRNHDEPEQTREAKFKSLLHFTRHTQTHSLKDGQYYDLSGMNLRGVNFQNSDLRGANLKGAIVSKADFSGANLDGANLSGIVARATVFTGASMIKVFAPDARMSDIEAKGINISGANFSGTNFCDARLQGITAVGAILDGISARGDLTWLEGDFTDASFKNASIGSGAFIWGEAKRADFTDANLKSASMAGLKAPHAKFVRTKLGYTSLGGADLRGCDFSGAKSNICTSFENADMTDALYMAQMVSKTSTKPKATEVSQATISAVKANPAKLARVARGKSRDRSTTPAP